MNASLLPTRAQGLALRPRERFAVINHERLRRAHDLLERRQRDVLDLLPYLFHVNQPELPGYVSGPVPVGIMGYLPDTAALSAATAIARKHRVAQRALRSHDIIGLYLMGSIGSIAQTATSDFDVWVCHPAALNMTQREELRLKARLIERWASDYGVEVHCFVFSPEEFARGICSDLSQESSGSSQHYLLLDEFYRSGLLLAGQMPRWTQGGDAEEGWGSGFGFNAEVADFGSLEHIPAREFFGAAIWQVYKSIASPYKSVLKLLLVEAYAAEFPNCELLSAEFKRAVLDGQTDLDILDPYLRMYRRIERYLLSRDDRSRLELARRCLYLKVGENLSSREATQPENWRRALMQRLVQEWGWNEGQTLQLDRQGSWRFHAVKDEGRALMAAVTASYRSISEFARLHSDDLSITQEDLNALGRKLYAAFERRPGKLEVLNRGICRSMVEEKLSWFQQPTSEGKERWLTFLGRVLPDDLDAVSPVRRSPSLVDSLIWAYVNGLVARQSVLTVVSAGNLVTSREARQILDVAEEVFPGGQMHEPTATDLAGQQALVRAAVFVNVGIDPLASMLREGEHLTTDRSNALSFGGLHSNLARTFELVLSTSWGEGYVHRFAGEHALLDFLVETVRWMTRSHLTTPPSVHVIGGGHASTIQRRIEGVLLAIVRCLAEQPRRRRFILEVAGLFYVLHLNEGEVLGEVAEDRLALVRLLSRPLQGFHRTIFDSQTLVDDGLSVVMQANRPGVIQITISGQAEDCEVYVVDDRGALFHQTVRTDNRNAMLEHMQRFLRNVTQRNGLAEGQAPMAVESCALRPSGSEGPRLARIDELRFETEKPYLEIRVLVYQQSARSRREYGILLGDREFSSLEHGSRLFAEVAAAVRELRRGRARYPVYITDVELMPSNGSVHVSQLLSYKRTIEEHLNRLL